MKHFALPEFRQACRRLPGQFRNLAHRSFALPVADPTHPSLQFKSVGRFWSVRVGLRYRARGVRDRDDVVWFWIGSHADYDRLLR